MVFFLLVLELFNLPFIFVLCSVAACGQCTVVSQLMERPFWPLSAHWQHIKMQLWSINKQFVPAPEWPRHARVRSRTQQWSMPGMGLQLAVGLRATGNWELAVAVGLQT